MVLPASHRVSVPCGTQDTPHLLSASPTGLSPCFVALPRAFGSPHASLRKSYNPASRSRRFRLLRFRSPLLTEYLSFPRATEMFQFTRFPSRRIARVHRAGFPHSEIVGYYVCTRLANAYRSVPRPSSALDAKAFPVCPYLLTTTDTEKRELSLLRTQLCVLMFVPAICGC